MSRKVQKKGGTDERIKSKFSRTEQHRQLVELLLFCAAAGEWGRLGTRTRMIPGAEDCKVAGSRYDIITSICRYDGRLAPRGHRTNDTLAN